MGHQRLGRLPRTRGWSAVVGLIAGGRDAATIAAQVAKAAETTLLSAASDPTLRDAYFLLIQIPTAARATHFAEALHQVGVETGSAPDLADVAAALSASLDRVGRTYDRISDFGEMASKSAVEGLLAIAARDGVGLLGGAHAADEARAVLSRLATPRMFGILARETMSRLLRACLGYYLSRELPNHVGFNLRFPSAREHHAFNQALGLHCREATRIMEQYAAEWYSKTNFEEGFTPANVGRFASVAFKKVVKELRARQVEHA